MTGNNIGFGIIHLAKNMENPGTRMSVGIDYSQIWTLSLRSSNIDTLSEARYAEETRTDIRVSYGSKFAVPIEIKKNGSKDIWRGIPEQLVAKYARDPKAESYGIYVVLWFGAEYMKIVAPQGGLPKDPQELQNLLKKHLNPVLKEKIHVVVIDVSRR